MRKTLVVYCIGITGLLINVFISSNVNATVVLQYHHIDENTPKSTSLSPKLFEQHLDYLQDNDYRVLSMSEFISSLAEPEESRAKSVVITFDDGYQSIYKNAFPLLKERKLPFTVFINTLPLINELPQFMSWRQLKEMSQFGASIVNHSVNHPHLIRRQARETEAMWTVRITNEIKDAQTLIENQLGYTPKVFAYPFGEYDLQVKKIVKTLGYIGFSQHSGAVDKNTDLLAIPRFPFGGSYGSMEDFKVKVSSLAMPIHSIELIGNDGQRLEDHVLSNENLKPSLHLILSDSFKNLKVQCFLSGHGSLEVKEIESLRVVKSPVELKPGRSRINCTAPTGKGGQFYWFSQTWIVRNRDGSWYKE